MIVNEKYGRIIQIRVLRDIPKVKFEFTDCY